MWTLLIIALIVTVIMLLPREARPDDIPDETIDTIKTGGDIRKFGLHERSRED